MVDLLDDQQVINKYKINPKSFTRNRTLSFKEVVVTILNLFKESVEFNLAKILPLLAKEVVSASAFTQARYKIKFNFFSMLAQKTAIVYENFPKQLWKGLQLIGVDGSTLNLPPTKSVIGYFGLNEQTSYTAARSLANILFFYDVMNGFILDGQIAKRNVSEHSFLKKGLQKVAGCVKGTKRVFLLDRNFGYFPIIFSLIKDNRLFCTKIPLGTSTFAGKILADGKKDVILDWAPTRHERSSTKAKGFIPETIKVRVVTVKKKGKDNKEVIEVLVTNLLDQNTYSYEDIEQLYNYRWQSEEGFKNFKPKMKTEQFGARKATGILQEFYAHIFCANMVALSGILAGYHIRKKTEHRKLVYRYNWKNAFRFFRFKTVFFLILESFDQKLDELIREISNSLVAIRPNRSYVRNLRHRNKRIEPVYK